jgi:hypothetical protein
MMTSSIQEIKFSPRWREELVATSSEGVLIFELTMGKYHVYFPDENRWKNQVPEWAKMKWDIFLSACKTWCEQNKIPISVVPDALVYEEKK